MTQIQVTFCNSPNMLPFSKSKVALNQKERKPIVADEAPGKTAENTSLTKVFLQSKNSTPKENLKLLKPTMEIDTSVFSSSMVNDRPSIVS